MDWMILITAGLFETGFAFCMGKMKEAKGLRHALWCGGFVVCLALSMVLLGIAVFGDRATAARLFFITTLIISIIGLKTV